MTSKFPFQSYVEDADLPKKMKKELNALFDANLDKPYCRSRHHGLPISTKAQATRVDNLLGILVDLRKEKYLITSVYSIKEKHVEFLIEKWVGEGRKRGTIENKLSCLGALATWTKRANVVKKFHQYPVLERLEGDSSFTNEYTSWKSSGFSIDGVLTEIMLDDVLIGIQLMFVVIFGLKVEEALLVRPLESLKQEGYASYITIENGTKRGRRREVQVYNLAAEIEFMDNAKEFVNGKSNTLIPLEYTLKKWTSRFKSVIAKHGLQRKGKYGVTALGLRRRYLDELDDMIANKKRFDCVTKATEPDVADGDKP